MTSDKKMLDGLYLRYLNHSNEYWSMVAMYMPNYKEAQAWLKKNVLGLTL